MADNTGYLTALGDDEPREVAGYRLLARIGEGGMGTVYLSYTRGNQPVALKVIRREYARDVDFRRRFQQEVRAARQVQGYHLVPVVDHDTTGDEPWLASTFVPALPLNEALDAYGPLPLTTVLQLMGCAAEALRAVHAAGVIHRDLKPSNLLLGSQGPWVIDFGIARAADATQLTRSGGLIGTPQYMSPEHADGRPLTPASDVFALGLVAAVAATGRHPYGDGGAITLATKIANTEFRPPSLSAYPEPLQGILERCLAADPEARPTPTELAALCEEASGRRSLDFDGWLPGSLAAEIARREAAAQQPPGPETVAPSAPAGATVTRPPRPAATPHTPPRPGPAAQPGHAPSPGSAGRAGHAPQPGFPPPAGAAPYPAVAPARRRKAPVIAGTIVAVLLAVSAVWAFQRDDKAASGTGAQGGDAKTATTPAGTPKADASKGGASKGGKTSVYTTVFENKPLTLRGPNPFTYTVIDLDVPKVVPGAENDYEVALSPPAGTDLIYYHWSGISGLKFVTPTGRSQTTDAKGCRSAVDTDALPGEIDGIDKLDTEFPKGTVLCTVTTDGKLAMLEITDVTPHEGNRPDYATELTLWSIS
ncbi:hypothetical protein GCM10010261_19700 [Streptomyces pilosus]|uniref:serine/threonine-protein kinase n=1 Tax=Streptomyces pilosus TaxID=28893 RepID=UPI001678233A|nr:serine/threonine-protein kinase [Streptomyces pilosus]GGV45440.1 hypothetical protein GCM10010261_19700 [Streptomyces pilosus]